MKENNKKVIIIITIITSVLLIALGVSYAFFSYSRTGSNQDLVVGDIYMHYNESNVISLQGVMPSNTYDENKYFEFKIDGKNTYTKKDIIYDIVLSHGDAHETRSERIRDNLLKFRLVEIKDGRENVVVEDKSYTDLVDKRIYVNTISKNTNEEIRITYRLYMWISDNTKIGNTSEADYDMETWNNEVYASIKVNVTGDFNEKGVLDDSQTIKMIVKEKNTETCKTYIEENGITYISGSKDCIDFNYVWYSGKLWRITAIYPDGTMKMITDDLITTMPYDDNDVNFYTDESNKSYMYQWLNEDFLDTLYNYQNIIVTDNKWDTQIIAATDELPSNSNLVTAPVGLLTSYEYYMNYKNLGIDNYSDGYLNIDYDWWLLNPGYSGFDESVVWMVYDGGPCTEYGRPSISLGVRPSIHLKSSIKITGGTGTKGNPYRISGDIEESTANTTLLNTRTSGEYVTFDGELYRIVSIEGGKTKVNKNDYVKDASNEVLGKMFSTDVTFGNGTSDEYWDYYLNNTWYNEINAPYKNMIVEGTYYVGEVGDGSSYKGAICKVASDTVTTKECEKTASIWTGYVGLPRVGEMFASQQGSGQSTSSNMWLMNPRDSSDVWCVASNGSAGNCYGGMPAARSSMYLKSTVKITGGNGTKEQPFEIGL